MLSLSLSCSSAGWAPSTFRSSRESKADSSTQKPEDFMDAEVTQRSNYSQSIVLLFVECRIWGPMELPLVRSPHDQISNRGGQREQVPRDSTSFNPA